MLVYCYKCLNYHRVNNQIPKTGKPLQCLECGHRYTLYPSNDIISRFWQYAYQKGDLSGRSLYIISRYISSVDHFLSLSRKDFLKFKNCGPQTATELFEYKKILPKKLGLEVDENKTEKTSITKQVIPKFLKDDTDLFEIVLDQFTNRSYEFVINKVKADSLEKIMALRVDNLLWVKGCGNKSIGGLRRIQSIVFQLAEIIRSKNSVKYTDFKSLIKTEKSARKLFNIGEDIEPKNPFPFLNNWILDISNNSKRNKTIFMKRMGMLGDSPKTYQQIALKYNISRERIRGIVEKIKLAGQRPIYRLRLDPLIGQVEKIVRSYGGKVALADLISLLLNQGPQGNLLKHALPFIKYLDEFSFWQESGLKIKDGHVFIDWF